jgi:hypothetical protein
MRRRFAISLLLTLALAACSSPSPSSLAPDPTVSPSPTPIAGASGAPVVRPDRPYDAATLLAAMRDSRRPGGVPDQLETDQVADALARAIWTWDGSPWGILSIGGACGPSSCSLEVVGSSNGTAGPDLYSFSIDAANGEVTLEQSDLHAYPVALDTTLDQLAQAAAGDELRGLAFAGARWLPPPDDGRYWLAYRTGGEEGAPGVDVLLDTATGEVLELKPV